MSDATMKFNSDSSGKEGLVLAMDEDLCDEYLYGASLEENYVCNEATMTAIDDEIYEAVEEAEEEYEGMLVFLAVTFDAETFDAEKLDAVVFMSSSHSSLLTSRRNLNRFKASASAKTSLCSATTAGRSVSQSYGGR